MPCREQAWKHSSCCSSPLVLGRPGALSMSGNILNLFSWAVGLESGLETFNTPHGKQKCCCPGFALPLRQHMQSRLRAILTGPRTFRKVTVCLQPKVTSCFTPNKTQPALWSFEARPTTPSLAMKVLHGRHLLWEVCFISSENLLFRVATFINHLSQIFWETRLHQHLLLHLALLWKQHLSLNLMNPLLLTSDPSSAASSSLSSSGTEGWGPCSGWGRGPTECCDWLLCGPDQLSFSPHWQ